MCHVSSRGLPLLYYVDRCGHLLSCYDYAGKQYLVMDWHQSARVAHVRFYDTYPRTAVVGFELLTPFVTYGSRGASKPAPYCI